MASQHLRMVHSYYVKQQIFVAYGTIAKRTACWTVHPSIIYDYVIQNGGVDQIWPMSRCLSKEGNLVNKVGVKKFLPNATRRLAVFLPSWSLLNALVVWNTRCSPCSINWHPHTYYLCWHKGAIAGMRQHSWRSQHSRCMIHTRSCHARTQFCQTPIPVFSTACFHIHAYGHQSKTLF